ncbi:LPS biosynthesis-related glycosyltransferase [Helicobacter mustelae]|uniref:hypothetical protein n=1 Tax=Helicobacter mustelae TaxID=217 RepID=UPI000DFF60ED|nr:hypothetical protein [Helicobacter mustelae]STP12426.1 LPS biosynthesis-related glycosyltransferase [Helicobacter mustelae]
MRNQPIEVLHYEILNKRQGYRDLPTTQTPISGQEYLLKHPHCIGHGCVWLHALRKDFIIRHNLSFIPNILHEDMVFIAEILLHAKSILFTSLELYYYRIREGSIMNSKPTKERILQALTSYYIIAQNFIHLAEMTQAPQLKKIFLIQIYTYFLHSLFYSGLNPKFLYISYKNFSPLFSYLPTKERLKIPIHAFFYFFKSLVNRFKALILRF